MRKVTLALAVLAVVAMASTSFAGTMMYSYGDVVFTVSETPGFAYEGLDSYLVQTTGTNAFVTPVIEGTVHQANMKYAAVTPSGFPGDLMGMPEPLAVDTHFGFLQGDAIVVPGGSIVETNDGEAISAYPPFTYGFGTFATVNYNFTFAGAGVLDGLDFMQVVIPKGTTVYLTGSCVDVANTVSYDFSVPVGIPEPGTVIMLIAGALCLAVARFRK